MMNLGRAPQSAGNPPLVVLLSAFGEDHFATRLANRIQQEGYDVWHAEVVKVGDQVSEEMSARLLNSTGPVVVCGTVRAAGTAWVRYVLGAVRGIEPRRVFVVRLEAEADLAHLALNAKIAECHEDFEAGARDLLDGMRSRFPVTPVPPDPAVAKTEERVYRFDDWLTEITEVSAEAVREYRSRLRPEVREVLLPDRLDTETFLSVAEMTRDQALFAPAVLIFSETPTKVAKSATIQCAHYHGSDRSARQVSRELRGPLIEQLDQAMRFLETRVEQREVIVPGEASASVEYQYPMICLREVIANAVCHRDYLDDQREIHIRLFDDRIEVESPGEWGSRRLEAEVTYQVAELQSASVRRNTRLAKALRWVYLAELEGSGIPKALRDCAQKNAPTPIVTNRDGVVTVTVFPRVRVSDHPGRRLPMRVIQSAVFVTVLLALAYFTFFKVLGLERHLIASAPIVLGSNPAPVQGWFSSSGRLMLVSEEGGNLRVSACGLATGACEEAVIHLHSQDSGSAQSSGAQTVRPPPYCLSIDGRMVAWAPQDGDARGSVCISRVAFDLVESGRPNCITLDSGLAIEGLALIDDQNVAVLSRDNTLQFWFLSTSPRKEFGVPLREPSTISRYANYLLVSSFGTRDFGVVETSKSAVRGYDAYVAPEGASVTAIALRASGEPVVGLADGSVLELKDMRWARTARLGGAITALAVGYKGSIMVAGDFDGVMIIEPNGKSRKLVSNERHIRSIAVENGFMALVADGPVTVYRLRQVFSLSGLGAWWAQIVGAIASVAAVGYALRSWIKRRARQRTRRWNSKAGR